MRFLMTLLTIALSVALASCQRDPVASAQDAVTASVEVAKPSLGQMPRIAVAYGDIVAGPASQQAVGFGMDGRVVSLVTVAGDTVRRGQELGVFQFSASSVAAYGQARSAVDVAAGSLARLERLRDDHLATDEQLAQARKAYADAQASLTVYPRQTMRSGSVPIVSPIDGKVVALSASVGQPVAANTPVLIVAPEGDQVLLGGVEPELAAQIRPGMSVDMTPVAGGAVVPATVLRAGGAIDGTTHLVPVQIRPDRPLLLGSAWRADIALTQVKGWIVPADAVVEEGAQRWLYQVREGRAYRVSVQVLLERDGTAVLQGDVAPDRLMVVKGGTQLSEGMNVAVSGASE